MRKLTPDERRLWDFVTRSVTPLQARHATREPASALSPATGPQRSDAGAPPEPAPRPAQHAPLHAPLHMGRAVDLDAATARKFKRGRMPCDGRIDLHGLTLAQAHGALIHFIHQQAERGSRCVLVITGKGSSRDDDDSRPRGRIRAELMHWLNSAPLRAHILAVTEAGPGRGGTGASYVLLKRRR